MLRDDGRSARGLAIRGRLTYAPPVFEKIVRQATARIEGLRMEPPGSGDLLETVLLLRPLHALVRWLLHALPGRRGRRQQEVSVQVAWGWRIPEMARRTQAAVAQELRRLTDYQQVIVNVHVSGTFQAGEGTEP